MKGLSRVILAILLLTNPPSLWAEYIIYLKGGHYIIAENCTFPSRKGIDKGSEGEKEFIFVEDCMIGEPDGPIFWSTIDGKFGEIDANNVFAIYGGKGLRDHKPPRERMPLEDYLITNRRGSFVNAKVTEQRKDHVYGVKRDELAKIDRRGVTEIAPEGVAKGPRGEGLCPREPPEFSFTDIDFIGDNLVGFVENLSNARWKPSFELEVHAKPPLQLKLRAKRSFVGKFKVEDSNELGPGEGNNLSVSIPDKQLLGHTKRAIDPEGDAYLCAKKVRQPPGQPTEVSSPASPPATTQALPGPPPSPPPPLKR